MSMRRGIEINKGETVMKKLIILSALLLTACATPVTVMHNPHTGKTETCGGEVGPSIALGAIGYQIAKQNDDDCVTKYQSGGYKVEKITQ